MVFLHHAFPHDPVFWTNLGVPRLIANLLAGIGATGAFGVSVFFVLSSYLITELLLREKDLIGTLDMRSFYIRRILRIWPLYFAFLALAVALQWILPGQHVTLRAGLWFSLLAGNWFIVFHGFPSSVIFPLWSVSIEEQFYITWPAVVRRASETAMLVIAGLLLAVATATRIYLGLHHVGESDAWCNTFVQLDPIVIGILLAVLLRGEIPRLSRLGRVALMLGGITGLAMGSMYFGIKNDPLTTTRLLLGYPSVAIGGGLLLLSVLRVKDGGSIRPLVYLGRISYGLYVFHVLGLLISNQLVSDQTGKSVAVCVTGWRRVSRDDPHGGDFLSLAGNPISAPEAALHPCAIATGRIRRLEEDGNGCASTCAYGFQCRCARTGLRPSAG